VTVGIIMKEKIHAMITQEFSTFHFLLEDDLRARVGLVMSSTTLGLRPTSAVGILLFSLSQLVGLSLHIAREYYHYRRAYHQRKLSVIQ